MVTALRERALEDSNPRHRVLETRVLPTELRTHGVKVAAASVAKRYPFILLDRAVKTLLQAGGLTNPVAQIIELRSTNLATAKHFNAGNLGSME